MRLADEKFVFFSQGGKNGGSEAMEHTVQKIFGTSKIKIFDDLDDIKLELNKIMWSNKNLLLLRTGNEKLLDFTALTKKILKING